LETLLENPNGPVPESLKKIFDTPSNGASQNGITTPAAEAWTIDDPKVFRRKLFSFSPPTRSFAETHGAAALERGSSIVLNSVLIAALLELWRANVLERDHNEG